MWRKGKSSRNYIKSSTLVRFEPPAFFLARIMILINCQRANRHLLNTISEVIFTIFVLGKKVTFSSIFLSLPNFCINFLNLHFCSKYMLPLSVTPTRYFVYSGCVPLRERGFESRAETKFSRFQKRRRKTKLPHLVSGPFFDFFFETEVIPLKCLAEAKHFASTTDRGSVANSQVPLKNDSN